MERSLPDRRNCRAGIRVFWSTAGSRCCFDILNHSQEVHRPPAVQLVPRLALVLGDRRSLSPRPSRMRQSTLTQVSYATIRIDRHVIRRALALIHDASFRSIDRRSSALIVRFTVVAQHANSYILIDELIDHINARAMSSLPKFACRRCRMRCTHRNRPSALNPNRQAHLRLKQIEFGTDPTQCSLTAHA